MRCVLLSCLLLCTGPALAQAPAQAPPPAVAAEDIPITDLQAVTVSPDLSGPGLWKVSRGDHVLWILGTVSPLPRRMAFETRGIERIVADAQEVLQPPGMDLVPKIGLLRGLYLGPSLLRARRNADGATLQERVPADQYARWSALKARYLGDDAGVEHYRPIFAAGELYRKAVARSGLTYDSPVLPAIERIARRHGVAVTSTKLQVEVRHQRAALREFAGATLDDGDCFARTLDRIDAELVEMRARADAWAAGDLQTLRRLPPVSAQYEACANALTGSAVAQRLGLGDVLARSQAHWLRHAERALGRNRVTFAVVPLPELARPGGVLDRLRGQGYAVVEPDAGAAANLAAAP